jgi:hypothetical protein
MIIATLVPFADLYYTLKLEKFRKFMAISLALTVPFAVAMSVLGPIPFDADPADLQQLTIPVLLILGITGYATGITKAVQLVLIYRWITKYNLQFFGYESKKDWREAQELENGS